MSLRIDVDEFSDDIAKLVSFWLEDEVYEIAEVLAEWRGASALYFKVKADEGKVYVLWYDGAEDEWTLQIDYDGIELMTKDVARPLFRYGRLN